MEDDLHQSGEDEMSRSEEERNLLDAWRLALPTNWRFEEESNAPEIDDSLREQIRQHAEALLNGEDPDQEFGGLLHRFESLYQEFGRITAEVFTKTTQQHRRGKSNPIDQ